MDNQGVTADPQLQQFIEIESQKQRFQQLVHQMTEVCWVSVFLSYWAAECILFMRLYFTYKERLSAQYILS